MTYKNISQPGDIKSGVGPDETRSTVNVVEVALVALVRCRSTGFEVLLTRRPPGVHLGGLWELPGGKLETDDAGRPVETARQAAGRELREELGITIHPDMLRPVGTTSHVYPDRSITFDLFVAFVDYELMKLEVKSDDSHEWVDVLRLGDWPLPPANVAVNNLLVAHLTKQELEA
jgi:8-oxo-dGTP diphosphatase